MIREQDHVFDRRLRELEAAKRELTERLAALEAKVEGSKPSEESSDSGPLVERAVREIMRVYQHGPIVCERTAREGAMRILAPLVEGFRQAEHTACQNVDIAAGLLNERDKLREQLREVRKRNDRMAREYWETGESYGRQMQKLADQRDAACDEANHVRAEAKELRRDRDMWRARAGELERRKEEE